ncbi:MAG: RNA 2',3'-cyclic phosphodiesterase [Pseudomonadota bacterium]
MIRSFIAIPVRGEAARALRARQSPIAGARAVQAEDFHLTLAFLGDQTEALLRALADDLDALVPDPFEVTLTHPDLIGGAHPRAIAWMARGQHLGFKDPLTRLHEKLIRAAQRAGVDLPRRRFRPHVTVYRLPRTPAPDTSGGLQAWLARQAGAAPITFTATTFELIESRLTPEGPIYTTLADFLFAGYAHAFDPNS